MIRRPPSPPLFPYTPLFRSPPQPPSPPTTTVSSPPIPATPQPPSNPPRSTKTKAPLPPLSAISAAIRLSSKIFSKPSSKIAPPPAMASRGAAASPSSKPSTEPQRLLTASPPSDGKISQTSAHLQRIQVEFSISIVVHEVHLWPQLSRLLKKASCPQPPRLNPGLPRNAIWRSTPFAASSC